MYTKYNAMIKQLHNYAPINVMPHLPPPEGGGDKGGGLTTFPSNSPPLGLSS